MVGIAELKRGNTAVGVGRLFAVLNAAAEDAAITPAAAWWVRKAANALVDHVVADGLSDDQAKLIAVLRKLRVSGAPHEFGPLWFEANCRIADTLARRGDRRAARECYRQLIAEASGVAPLSETEDSLLLMAAENLAKLCLADGSAAALDVALGALDTVEKTSQSGRAKLAALRAEVQAAYNLK
ncbi:hypothetical protein SDC9_161974 [bioreactor metagenome]|uniref:Bacterial transcriptional activator domain-containing protein n=1 Tax=bioreactor metagenome TaxID=1076179 RepID=A0A645FJR6_9ZZZZ